MNIAPAFTSPTETALSHLKTTLKPFMSIAQRMTLLRQLEGEEAEGIAEIVNRISDIVWAMPKTYETQWQGTDALVYLHYFKGAYDAWIAERDIEPEQLQAFGMASFYGPEEAEFGYVCIAEILEAGAELDLYFDPRPISAIANDE